MSLARAAASRTSAACRRRSWSCDPRLQPDQRAEWLGQDQPARGDLPSRPRPLFPDAPHRAADPARRRSSCVSSADASNARRSSQPIGVRLQPGRASRPGSTRRPVESLAELSRRVLPVQIIDPEVHRLVEEGPQQRRRWLDWGVFHVEPSFVEHWRRYQRALRQRNAALRAGQARAVPAWDPELVRSRRDASAAHGRGTVEPTAAARRTRSASGCSGIDDRTGLHRGWARGADALARRSQHALARDQERGTDSRSGPIAPTCRSAVGGRAGTRSCVSRAAEAGRPRRCCSAQLQLRSRSRGPSVRLCLLDDPAAELDATNLERLVDGGPDAARRQLFVTALRPANLGASAAARWPKCFTWNTAASTRLL